MITQEEFDSVLSGVNSKPAFKSDKDCANDFIKYDYKAYEKLLRRIYELFEIPSKDILFVCGALVGVIIKKPTGIAFTSKYFIYVDEDSKESFKVPYEEIDSVKRNDNSSVSFYVRIKKQDKHCCSVNGSYMCAILNGILAIKAYSLVTEEEKAALAAEKKARIEANKAKQEAAKKAKAEAEKKAKEEAEKKAKAEAEKKAKEEAEKKAKEEAEKKAKTEAATNSSKDVIKMQRARRTYETICACFDEHDWTYSRDDEKMEIKIGSKGDDLPIDTFIRVMPDRQLISLLSLLPFTISKEKRLETAVAVCMVNDKLANGSFDYDIKDGQIFFRLTNSFWGSEIGTKLFGYMLIVSINTINDYNAKFLALSKGQLALEDFMDKEED